MKILLLMTVLQSG